MARIKEPAAIGVTTCEAPDVAAAAHFHYHRQRVDVNRCPRQTNQGENDVHHRGDNARRAGKDEAEQEAERQQGNAKLNRPLAPDFRRQSANRDVGANRARRRDEQAR